MGGPASSNLSFAKILEATVVGVDRSKNRVAVSYNHSPGGAPEVRLSALYTHAAEGEGGDVFPEVGANCLVAFISDSPDPVIFAYLMPPTTNREGDLGPREERQGGDISFSTRDGNTVTLRRGGLVQIGASPLAQRFYVPVGNIIRDLFAQYEAVSLLGRSEWVHGEPGAKGTKATYRLELKDKVEDTFPTVELEVSSERIDLMPLYLNTESDIPDPFLPIPSQLRLKISDPTGLTKVFNFQTSPTGDTHLHVQGYTLLRSEGVFRVVPGSAYEVIGLAWKSKVDKLGQRTELLVSSITTCITLLQLVSPSISLEGLVNLGGPGGDGVLRGSSDVVAWFAELVAKLNLYGISIREFPSAAVSTVVRSL